MVFGAINGSLSLLSSCYRAVQAGGLQALWGTIPLTFYFGSFATLFLTTDWAWENPGHAMILLFPAYSLINSKQIVCNFTHMKMNLIPGSFLWFLLFPVNRYAIALIPALEPYSRGFLADGTSVLLTESYVAVIVFTITFTWYLAWCASTIT